MIPKTGTVNTLNLNVSNPSKCHRIQEDVLSGSLDGLEAVKQSIQIILGVERYRHLIYSSHYGAELTDLIGQPMEYVLPEVKRRITDALLMDDRITGVSNFEFKKCREKVKVTFTVSTIFGDTEAEKEVII